MRANRVLLLAIALAIGCADAPDHADLASLVALHVDVDPTPEWIETTYSDYRPVGGVLYPYKQVERQVATGKVLSTGTIREIRINAPLAADRFAPP